VEDTLRARLRAVTETYLRDSAGCHRLDHTLRVVENARRLAAAYRDVDVDALEAAAWLHDVGRGLQRKQGINHAEASAAIAADRLPQLGFSADRVALIVQAIADHRFSAGRTPSSLEGNILQDADRLDALGAIGIARTFSFEISRELYDTDDPFAEHRPADDTRYTLDHFFVKLLQLPETLHTPEGMTEARRRVKFLHAFLREMAEELGKPSPEFIEH
jgi:uncharacterized protein